MASSLTPHVLDDNTAIENDATVVEIGQWYWVKSDDREDWLGCVERVGSNYIRISSPEGWYRRIHFNDFWKELRPEPNAEAVIQERVAHYQQIANEQLEQVKAITARLGVSKQAMIGQHAGGSGAGNALLVMSGTPDIEGYKTALVRAKDEDLPKLFEGIKRANEKMATWMAAQVMPMKAMAEGMKGAIGEIKDRLFNVSLYAGLAEEIVQCCDGESAPFNEKLHVMQRRLYMDEECLLNYRHGGMEFKHIKEFDAWISEPENRDRILPMPRCLVAMRVRRHVKDREWDGKFLSAFINIQLEQSDKLTYLYIRNGERVYRLISDLDFGEHIFPDKSVFDPAEPMMARMFGSRVKELISRREYDEIERQRLERKARYDQWEADNPQETWDEKTDGPRWVANPHRGDMSHGGYTYEPFDPSSVYFDDIAEMVGGEIKQYNRIALIIQGLYDRSEVLHPHPPVRTWTADGFASAITLVYDGTAALLAGEAPDFEAYRARCNAILNADSVVCGQELYWMQREAEKENALRDRSYRSTEARVTTFRPYGNPGPGYLAKMAEWRPRARQAVFTWNRQRQTEDRWSGKSYGDSIRTSLTVPADRLFNISAYRPGDYLQFFRDHRTRAQYLQWAPMLLAAEEWQVGNGKAEKPLDEKN